MKGYVAKKGNRYYAVIYEGLDPVTGKEVRKWHPAGTCRGEAESLASRLAEEVDDDTGSPRSLTFGAYLTQQWLPGKANTLAKSTWQSYRRKIERHVLPTLGAVPIRRLKVTHLEALTSRSSDRATQTRKHWHARPFSRFTSSAAHSTTPQIAES